MVTFRDVPEAIAQGDDEAEAAAHAADALETAPGFHIDARAAPVPSKARRGERMVDLSAVSRS
jgi:antitoxin HicB